jgi:hypothetical protein
VKFSTRELVLMAVFGSLWGIVEMSLGAVLKSLNLPLGGVILAAIGLTIALTGRIFVPRKGSTLFIGVVAMLLKLFSLGGVVLGPMVGILAAALIAEISLSLLGSPSRFGFVISAGLGTLWSLAQPFVTGPLLFGRVFTDIWLSMLARGGELLGINPDIALWIVVVLTGLHLLIGAAAGWLAWSVGQRLERRIGSRS